MTWKTYLYNNTQASVENGFTAYYYSRNAPPGEAHFGSMSVCNVAKFAASDVLILKLTASTDGNAFEAGEVEGDTVANETMISIERVDGTTTTTSTSTSTTTTGT